MAGKRSHGRLTRKRGRQAGLRMSMVGLLLFSVLIGCMTYIPHADAEVGSVDTHGGARGTVEGRVYHDKAGNLEDWNPLLGDIGLNGVVLLAKVVKADGTVVMGRDNQNMPVDFQTMTRTKDSRPGYYSFDFSTAMQLYFGNSQRAALERYDRIRVWVPECNYASNGCSAEYSGAPAVGALKDYTPMRINGGGRTTEIDTLTLSWLGTTNWIFGSISNFNMAFRPKTEIASSGDTPTGTNGFGMHAPKSEWLPTSRHTIAENLSGPSPYLCGHVYSDVTFRFDRWDSGPSKNRDASPDRVIPGVRIAVSSYSQDWMGKPKKILQTRFDYTDQDGRWCVKWDEMTQVNDHPERMVVTPAKVLVTIAPAETVAVAEADIAALKSAVANSSDEAAIPKYDWLLNNNRFALASNIPGVPQGYSSVGSNGWHGIIRPINGNLGSPRGVGFSLSDVACVLRDPYCLPDLLWNEAPAVFGGSGVLSANGADLGLIPTQVSARYSRYSTEWDGGGTATGKKVWGKISSGRADARYRLVLVPRTTKWNDLTKPENWLAQSEIMPAGAAGNTLLELETTGVPVGDYSLVLTDLDQGIAGDPTAAVVQDVSPFRVTDSAGHYFVPKLSKGQSSSEATAAEAAAQQLRDQLYQSNFSLALPPSAAAVPGQKVFSAFQDLGEGTHRVELCPKGSSSGCVVVKDGVRAGNVAPQNNWYGGTADWYVPIATAPGEYELKIIHTKQWHGQPPGSGVFNPTTDALPGMTVPADELVDVQPFIINPAFIDSISPPRVEKTGSTQTVFKGLVSGHTYSYTFIDSAGNPVIQTTPNFTPTCAINQVCKQTSTVTVGSATGYGTIKLYDITTGTPGIIQDTAPLEVLGAKATIWDNPEIIMPYTPIKLGPTVPGLTGCQDNGTGSDGQCYLSCEDNNTSNGCQAKYGAPYGTPVYQVNWSSNNSNGEIRVEIRDHECAGTDANGKCVSLSNTFHPGGYLAGLATKRAGGAPEIADIFVPGGEYEQYADQRWGLGRWYIGWDGTYRFDEAWWRADQLSSGSQIPATYLGTKPEGFSTYLDRPWGNDPTKGKPALGWANDSFYAKNVASAPMNDGFYFYKRGSELLSSNADGKGYRENPFVRKTRGSEIFQAAPNTEWQLGIQTVKFKYTTQRTRTQLGIPEGAVRPYDEKMAILVPRNSANTLYDNSWSIPPNTIFRRGQVIPNDCSLRFRYRQTTNLALNSWQKSLASGAKVQHLSPISYVWDENETLPGGVNVNSSQVAGNLGLTWTPQNKTEAQSASDADGNYQVWCASGMVSNTANLGDHSLFARANAPQPTDQISKDISPEWKIRVEGDAVTEAPPSIWAWTGPGASAPESTAVSYQQGGTYTVRRGQLFDLKFGASGSAATTEGGYQITKFAPDPDFPAPAGITVNAPAETPAQNTKTITLSGTVPVDAPLKIMKYQVQARDSSNKMVSFSMNISIIDQATVPACDPTITGWAKSIPVGIAASWPIETTVCSSPATQLRSVALAPGSSPLPTGMSLSLHKRADNTIGYVINGRAENDGTYPFTLIVTDGQGRTASANYTITVSKPADQTKPARAVELEVGYPVGDQKNRKNLDDAVPGFSSATTHFLNWHAPAVADITANDTNVTFGMAAADNAGYQHQQDIGLTWGKTGGYTLCTPAGSSNCHYVALAASANQVDGIPARIGKYAMQASWVKDAATNPSSVVQPYLVNVVDTVAPKISPIADQQGFVGQPLAVSIRAADLSNQPIKLGTDPALGSTTGLSCKRHSDQYQLPLHVLYPYGMSAATPGASYTGSPGIIGVMDNKTPATLQLENNQSFTVEQVGKYVCEIHAVDHADPNDSYTGHNPTSGIGYDAQPGTQFNLTIANNIGVQATPNQQQAISNLALTHPILVEGFSNTYPAVGNTDPNKTIKLVLDPSCAAGATQPGENKLPKGLSLQDQQTWVANDGTAGGRVTSWIGGTVSGAETGDYTCTIRAYQADVPQAASDTNSANLGQTYATVSVTITVVPAMLPTAGSWGINQTLSMIATAVCIIAALSFHLLAGASSRKDHTATLKLPKKLITTEGS